MCIFNGIPLKVVQRQMNEALAKVGHRQGETPTREQLDRAAELLGFKRY